MYFGIYSRPKNEGCFSNFTVIRNSYVITLFIPQQAIIFERNISRMVAFKYKLNVTL